MSDIKEHSQIESARNNFNATSLIYLNWSEFYFLKVNWGQCPISESVYSDSSNYIKDYIVYSLYFAVEISYCFYSKTFSYKMKTTCVLLGLASMIGKTKVYFILKYQVAPPHIGA